VADDSAALIAGAEVSVFGSAPVLTGNDGRFTLQNVPTIRGNIVAHASAILDEVPLRGSSAARAPVRGGVTDVGTITVSEAVFETQYGASLAQCDDCWVQVDLPFEFPFFGQNYPTVYFDGNGRVSFGFGDSDWTESIEELSVQPILSALWNDWDARNIPDSGIYYNGGLPGRAVFTWLNMPTFIANTSKPRITVQIILFDDGRVQFGYNGVNVPEGVTGISAGPGSPITVVDFAGGGDFAFDGPATIAEQFTFGTGFDLDHSFISWTPNPGGGFDVRVFSQPSPPLDFNRASPVQRALEVSLEAEAAPGKPSAISFISRLGERYQLEVNFSEDINENDWVSLASDIVGTGGELTLALPECPPERPCAFYRVILVPQGSR
jgi:hypothetical protein